MLLVFPFCLKDREQAARLAEWINELGPYPAHELLMVREQKAAPIPFGFGAKGFDKVHEIIVRDPDNKWPKSAGLMFRSAAKQIQYTTNESFFWIEPDCVPMREGWLDEIAAEYDAALRAGKHFLADLIDHRNAGPNFVLHASGICVYPKDLVHRAGEIFHAYDDIPFDIVAGPAIHSQAKQSELIMHHWAREGQALTFASWSDVEAKIFSRRPKCAIFHSDKSGSLIQLLREHIFPVTKGESSGAIVGVAPKSDTNFSGGVDKSHETHWQSGKDTPEATPKFSGECPMRKVSGSEVSRTQSSESSASPAESLSSSLDINCPSMVLQPVETATISPQPVSWHDQTPWENRDASLIEIRRIAARLRQFQTNRAYVRYVRTLLAEAGVIVPAKKKRRKKK